MQLLLERGSIDKTLTFEVGLIYTTQLISYQCVQCCSPNTCSQIEPRVCTLVLFIIIINVINIIINIIVINNNKLLLLLLLLLLVLHSFPVLSDHSLSVHVPCEMISNSLQHRFLRRKLRYLKNNY